VRGLLLYRLLTGERIGRDAERRGTMMDWAMSESPKAIEQPICCPICGVRLDEVVLALPDDEYFCPECFTQQKPGAAEAASAW
jgi:hypothetical protein